VQEFLKAVRIVKLEKPRLDEVDVICLATTYLNGQPRLPEGQSATDLFLGHPQWVDSLLPVSLSSQVQKDRIDALAKLQQKMELERSWRRKRGLRYIRIRKVCVGKYVCVHTRRFPSHPFQKTRSPWLGPYLVTELQGREATVNIGQHPVRVHLTDVKIAAEVDEGMPTDVPLMTEAEMEAESAYVVDVILRHRRKSKGTWEFPTELRKGGKST
jgi:hypothetical protein